MKRKIAAIDVGTTKVCTIMGTLKAPSDLKILGVGIAPSHGIEKGLVADVTKAKKSILESIKQAEATARFKIESAVVGVNGNHIRSMINKGTLAFTKTDQLVPLDDLKRMMDVALNIKAPVDKQLLLHEPNIHAHSEHGLKSAIGVREYDMNVESQAIANAITSVQNLARCIQEVGVDIEDLVLEPLAVAEAVLRPDEKQAGVLIANIGGGTTDIAVMKEGNLYHSSVLPVAGKQITGDIAAGLGLSFETAEGIKKKYGKILLSSEEDTDSVMEVDGQSLSRRDLCDIISIRFEEIMRLVMLRMPGTDFANLIPSGIVITGGSANIPGIVEMTRAITHLPVRIGVPPALKGGSKAVLNDPAYATSVGLVLSNMKNYTSSESNMSTNGSGIQGALMRLVRLFQ